MPYVHVDIVQRNLTPMNWLTNPFAVGWRKKNKKSEWDFPQDELDAVEHNEENKDCEQNRCGEWANCNNYECEGEHDCTCV